MPGIALRLFADRTGRTLDLDNKGYAQGPSWPIIDTLLSWNWISHLEVTWARRLLANCPQANDASALLLCYLFLAAKQGHLCVRIHDDFLDPPLEQLWTENASGDGEGNPFMEKFRQDLPGLQNLIRKGIAELPDDLVELLEPFCHKTNMPVCRWNRAFYLEKHWTDELRFCSELLRVARSTPKLEVDQTDVEQHIHALKSKGLLQEEQAKAVQQGCLGALTVISGGPGTGKTYTAGELIRTWWLALSEKSRLECRLILAAPTGKAAANLSASLGRVASSVEGLQGVKARTLHALLGLNSRGYSRNKVTDIHAADLIVVDECSMIDVHMMSALFSAVSSGSRLILLGDPHQLPPVEAGSLFADMIAAAKSSPALRGSVNQLHECLRAESKEIVTFAQAVHSGQKDCVLNILESEEHPLVSSLRLGSGSTAQQQQRLVHAIAPHFKFSNLDDPNTVLSEMGHFRLLTPLRKGDWGVDSLNKRVLNAVIARHSTEAPIAIPIMVVANDYRLELFNGDVGVLIRKRPPIVSQNDSRVDRLFDVDDYALFTSPDGSVRKLPAVTLPKYEYAYSMSVHKSQGSEFDHVIVLLPNGSEMFGREVLYTAVTRAKKSVQIWSQDQALAHIVEQNSHRTSSVSERLQALESREM